MKAEFYFVDPRFFEEANAFKETMPSIITCTGKVA